MSSTSRVTSGLATFCVLSPNARAAEIIDGVEPDALTTNSNGRTHRFNFTGVLGTAFDLPYFLTAPLIDFCVAGSGPATLLIGSPNRRATECHNVVLNVCSHLLPALFNAAGPRCSEIGITLLELRHSTIIDAQSIRKITSLADAEVTWVSHAGARVAWDAVMQKLSDRYSRGAASAEDSAFAVQLRLAEGQVFTVCDAGCGSAHLGTLTLILNSLPTVPAEKRTIAPRVGLTFLLEPLLAGRTHVVILPDAAVDATYTLRVLRFTSELHPTVRPFSEGDLFPPHPPSAGTAAGEASLLTSARGAATPLDRSRATTANTSAAALPPRSPRAGRSGATVQLLQRPHADPSPVEEVDGDEDWHRELADVSIAPGAPGSRPMAHPAGGQNQRGRVGGAPPGHLDESHISSPSSSDGEDFVSVQHLVDSSRRVPPRRDGVTGTSPPRNDARLADSYLAPAPRSAAAIPRATPPSSAATARLAGTGKGRGAGANEEMAARSPDRAGELERLRARMLAAEQDAYTARQSAESFDAELQRARRANAELSEELEGTQHELETLRATSRATHDENREMSDLLRKLSSRLTELQQASQRHRDETNGLRSAAEEAVAENEHLKRELHDAKKTLRVMEIRERDRVRNAALMRAGGSPDNKSSPSAAALQRSHAGGGGGATSLMSKATGRSSSVNSVSARPNQEGMMKRRIHELTTENAKLQLRLEVLTGELNQTRNAVVTSVSLAHAPAVSSNKPTGSATAADGAAQREVVALQMEVELLRAQLTSCTAELNAANEERSALQRVVVAHPRSNTTSDVLSAVAQSLLRGLELMITRLRADVAAVNTQPATAAGKQHQQQRAAQIATLEKMKTSIVNVAQKEPVGYIPSSASENDAATIALVMKAEIERLAHVKALLPGFATVCRECSKYGLAGGAAALDRRGDEEPGF
jgi:regulator of replication initiation timing